MYSDFMVKKEKKNHVALIHYWKILKKESRKK